MTAFDQFVKRQLKNQDMAFGPGDQVRVWYQIQEKDRVRLAPFEGLVIRRKGSGISETFTVRRMTHGEGVERGFPIHAPMLDRVEVLRRGKVKHARLYYLRTKIGKTRISAATAKAEGIPETEAASPQPAGIPPSGPSGDQPTA